MSSFERGSRPGYMPIYALPYWEIIGTFVSAAVEESATRAGRDARTLYPAAVAFVLWCWQTRGTPLERRRIFRTATIDEFVHLGMVDYEIGSKATYRATLRLMVRALDTGASTDFPRPLERSKPTEPYGDSDIAALHSWAICQSTPRRQNDALALLALGLGAGLATREILSVQRLNLRITSASIQVAVCSGRRRLVPIAREWEVPMRRIATDMAKTDWVFRPGRVSAAGGQVTDFLLRSRTELDIRPSRMRATWLLGHLTRGTPAEELLRIAGLKNYAALDSIRTFIPKSRATSGCLTEL